MRDASTPDLDRQSGSSQVLVLRGEAGVGKTSSLGYVCELAAGFSTVQVAGIQSDMDLALARRGDLAVETHGIAR